MGEGCLLCKDGVGAQLRFITAAAERATHIVGLLEVGQTVAREIREHSMAFGGLRGLCMEFTKHSFSKNSRMEVTVHEHTEPPWWRELAVPSIKKALYLGWAKKGISMPDLQMSEEDPVEDPRFVRPQVPHRSLPHR